MPNLNRSDQAWTEFRVSRALYVCIVHVMILSTNAIFFSPLYTVLIHVHVDSLSDIEHVFAGSQQILTPNSLHVSHDCHLVTVPVLALIIY